MTAPTDLPVSAARPAARPVRVVVAGNPNAGKSTLFNALTGANARVGNFPGTTVGSVTGRRTLPDGAVLELVDVPGTYSLAATSPDERVAIDAILGTGRAGAPDVLVLVADAPRLLRSLYLALQALELEVPIVLAVNLLDEARASGIEPDLDALSEALGVPVVGTVARRREGIHELDAALAGVLADPVSATPGSPVRWSPQADADADEIASKLPPPFASVSRPGSERSRGIARWLLLSADAEGRVPGIDGVLEPVLAARRRAAEQGRDLDAELVGTRYAWVDAREEVFLGRSVQQDVGWTERIDRIALHPVLGSLLFVGLMGLAFMALFAWADPLIGLVEALFGGLGGLVAGAFDSAIPAAPGAAGLLEVLRDLVVDGVIGGVGGVIVFLPQIALLFLFLAILEDCGYLSRAAHLTDRVLRTAGLPGRAFVPLLSGYACAVPAILATRTMPRFRDRLLTMMVIPLTSCSARLPVYTLLIAALFPATVWGGVPLRPLALAGMYLLSTSLALGAAIALGRTVLVERTESALIELPPYRVPDPSIVARLVWSRCIAFLREAGGIILAATIVLWALLYFPRYEPEDVLPPDVLVEARASGEDLEALAEPFALERSFGGRMGKAIEPVIAPLGYDWRIGVGLIGAFAAREVFVSTMGVVHGVGGDVDEDTPALRDRMRDEVRADGRPLYTPLVATSIMVFFAISLQCLSTLAVLRKESGSWVWPAAAFVSMTTLAWLAAFLVYQAGRLLGLS